MSTENLPIDVGDYIEEGYKGKHIFIPDDVYSRALDALVIACVDIFVLYNDKLFIAKRSRYPQQDWWLLGGRMRTGERLGDSARRILKNEAGIDIAFDRFHYLTTFTGAWKMRAHAPEENGTHTMSTVLYTIIGQEDFERIQLNDEYVDRKLIEVNELLATPQYHPALHQCGRAYLTIRG